MSEAYLSIGDKVLIHPWADRYPPSSLGRKVMYGFKLDAFSQMLSLGFSQVLWLDSSILPLRSFKPVWGLIAEQGYWLSKNFDYMTDRFVCDSALPLLGVSRQECSRIPQVMGGAIGINFDSRIGWEMFSMWRHYAISGAFEGPHVGGSDYPKIIGHRHDQTAMSVVAHNLNLVLTVPPQLIVEDGEDPTEDTVMAVRRMA
jgi:hypothetical protein